MSRNLSRREVLHRGMLAGGATALLGCRAWSLGDVRMEKMKLGFVTYLWGAKWPLPKLIRNLEESDVLGVELRVDHAHGVGLSLSKEERSEVGKRFADSPVALLGMGTNECYHHTDPEKLKQAVETTKAWLQLSHDCGGSGVKVKPDRFQKGVEPEVTIRQIGNSLRELGKYAADLGQEVRLEVHGTCCELPTIKAIMDVAEGPGVGVCWNSNPQDLNGEGLEHNFNLVKDRFGATAHVREFNVGDYPYPELIRLFVEMEYSGWILLECRSKVKDGVKALNEQRELFEKMVSDVSEKE